jgi:hypothetical protein
MIPAPNGLKIAPTPPISSPMFAAPNLADLLMHKFARLSGGRDLACDYFSPSSQRARCSASTVQDFGNFQDLGNSVKVWINLVGQIVKLPPGLAKVW